MFPTLVYRCPGTHQRPGGTYEYRPVKDDEQLAAALIDGWFPTLPEAITGKPAELEQKATETQPGAADVVDTTAPDSAPPTRAELEQKATELGITFGNRIGDAKLAALIEAKLKG